MTAVELLESLNLLDEHERIKGRGIRVMRESMEQAGLTPPLFESDRGNDQFVARYFFHHFLGEDDIAWRLHHPPQEIRDLVVELFTLRDWRVDELSVVLRRNPEVVRQNDLRPLMRDGRLAMTNPDEPNDPQQAYRANRGFQ